MHWMHSGNAAGAEYLPLIAVTCRHKLSREAGGAQV
jgi:hypothetical protein